MNKIFIEAKKEDTSECNFLKAILSRFFPDKNVCFICMDGAGNLFNEANRNQMAQTIEDEDNILVLLDADSPSKGYGFQARLKEVNQKKLEFSIDFPVFLYPDNSRDGDIENLMEDLVRKDLHKEWWDCFEDYEKCVGSIKKQGEYRYEMPNRKAKLHTFISSQKLSSYKRSKLGSGQWLFDDTNYWDLSQSSVQPLIDFFKANLK